MWAVVKRGSGFAGTRLEEVPTPRNAGDQVLLKVLAGGICGTDVRLADGDALTGGPVALGHEIVGEVADPGQTTFGRGEQVVGFPLYYWCGHCPACRSGAWNLCPERLSAGVKADGGFAEYVLLPREVLRPVPAVVEPSEAVMCEPLACSYHAVVEAGNVQAGERVVVVGAGTIGLIAVQVAVARGARVAVLECCSGPRVELATDFGADMVFVGADAADQAYDWCGDEGADAIVECAGAPEIVSASLALLGTRGRYVKLGTFGSPVTVDLDAMSRKEVQVLTAFASKPTSWDAALTMIRSRTVQLSPLLSAVLPLSRWVEGFERTRRGEGVKMVLDPTQEADV